MFLPKHRETSLFVDSCVSIKQILIQVFLPVRVVQSSILGHLESLGLLGRGRCFVEFGAGRGKLSHWIHEALKTSEHLETQEDLQLLLVERCTTRFKAGTPDPICPLDPHPIIGQLVT